MYSLYIFSASFFISFGTHKTVDPSSKISPTPITLPPCPSSNSVMFLQSSVINPLIFVAKTLFLLLKTINSRDTNFPAVFTIEERQPVQSSFTDSNTVPIPKIFPSMLFGIESLFIPSISRTKFIVSKRSSMPWPVFPDTCTTGIFPPIPSRSNPSFVISLLTFSMSIFGRSHLLITTRGEA